ncbi:MAG: YIP1 family protein [candidate division WOR-3 bacterium]
MDLILKIFFNPDEALKNIKEKKPLAVPFIILIIVTLIISLFYIQFVILPNRETLLMEREIPEEALQKTLEFFNSPLFYVFTLISAIFGFVFSTLIIGFIYFFISILLKGKGDFLAFFSSAVHIYAISLLGSIIAFPIAILKNSPYVNLDFSLFFMFLPEKNFLRVFFEQAGFFTLWSVFLYGLALHHIGEIERKKGILVSFSMWFIYAVIATIIKVFLKT